MRNIRFLLLLLAILTYTVSWAQKTPVEMADSFRAEGKIYVVVAIVLIVLAGLLAYLFFLDRKITDLEKQIRDKDQQTK